MALTPRDKRALMILGAAAVVGLIYVFLFVLGGGEEEQAVLPPAGPGPSAEEPSPGAPAPPPPREPPPVELAFRGRDPFSPPGIFVSPTVGVSPTSPPPTSPPPTSPPPTSPPPTSPPVDGSTSVGDKDVVLLAVTTDGTGRIEVNGHASGELSAGDTFRGVEGLSVTTTCGRFEVGGQTFSLCVTE